MVYGMLVYGIALMVYRSLVYALHRWFMVYGLSGYRWFMGYRDIGLSGYRMLGYRVIELVVYGSIYGLSGWWYTTRKRVFGVSWATRRFWCFGGNAHFAYRGSFFVARG